MEDVWNDIQELLKLEINLNAFNTWFKNVELQINENELTLYVENEFAEDWVRHNYSNQMKNAVFKVLEREVEIKVSSRKGEEASNTIASLL